MDLDEVDDQFAGITDAFNAVHLDICTTPTTLEPIAPSPPQEPRTRKQRRHRETSLIVVLKIRWPRLQLEESKSRAAGKGLLKTGRSQGSGRKVGITGQQPHQKVLQKPTQDEAVNAITDGIGELSMEKKMGTSEKQGQEYSGIRARLRRRG